MKASLTGVREDQQQRLALLDREAKALISATGLLRTGGHILCRQGDRRAAPLTPVQRLRHRHRQALRRRLRVLGVVYKVSNLILEIHLYLRDVKTGRVINHMHTNIRGNTDKSWLRGLRWLIKNRLKAPT